MDTFDKLDRVDLQILRTLQEKRPIDDKRVGCTGEPFLQLLFLNVLNGWRVEDI